MEKSFEGHRPLAIYMCRNCASSFAWRVRLIGKVYVLTVIYSLIAVMLGVLRMDINACIDAYVKMAREIFPKEGRLSASKFWKGKKVALGENRFETAPLEAAIKGLVKEKLGNGATGNEMLRSQSSQGCKV